MAKPDLLGLFSQLFWAEHVCGSALPHHQPPNNSLHCTEHHASIALYWYLWVKTMKSVELCAIFTFQASLSGCSGIKYWLCDKDSWQGRQVCTLQCTKREMFNKVMSAKKSLLFKNISETNHILNITRKNCEILFPLVLMTIFTAMPSHSNRIFCSQYHNTVTE